MSLPLIKGWKLLEIKQFIWSDRCLISHVQALGLNMKKNNNNNMKLYSHYQNKKPTNYSITFKRVYRI